MFRTLLFLCLLFLSVQPAWGSPSLNLIEDWEKQAVAIQDRALALTLPDPHSGERPASPAEVREKLAGCQAEIDRLLNMAWREVSGNMKAADEKLAKLLLDDQRAWLKFAESFCEKAQDHFGAGGTMYLTRAMYAKLNLWAERISYLNLINRSLTFE